MTRGKHHEAVSQKLYKIKT